MTRPHLIAFVYTRDIRICSNAGHGGFTLIEILIGMTLLGIIMVLLFSAFRMGVKSWDSGEQRAIEINNILVVQTFLRARLMSAQPLIDDFTDDEGEFSFVGTQQSLQFVSSLPARRGLKKFTLFIDADDDGALKIAVQPFFPTFDETESARDDLVLLEAIENIELTYFGSDSFGEEAEWHDQWEDRDGLPQLVKLEIEFRENKESWPPLTVRLRIEPGAT